MAFAQYLETEFSDYLVVLELGAPLSSPLEKALYKCLYYADGLQL